jgi:hypothetical protein
LLKDLAWWWGASRGLTAQAIQTVVHNHAVREDDGSLRFSLDKDADGEVTVKVMTSRRGDKKGDKRSDKGGGKGSGKERGGKSKGKICGFFPNGTCKKGDDCDRHSQAFACHSGCF